MHTVAMFRARAFPLLLCVLLSTGCASQRLKSARSTFYAGRPHDAGRQLGDLGAKGNNRILILMERGTIRQAAGDYEGSARDLIAAYDELEKLAALSVSKDTSSLVINDNVQDFRGAPYERTLLHTFTALDHFALGNWENAGVEARRIIRSLEPEVKKEYPDDAFSRYVAGFALEMNDDRSNASVQYRLASELAKQASIDPGTGRIAGKEEVGPARQRQNDAELVCFFILGRSPRGSDVLNRNWRPGGGVYAEIVADGQVAGRSYTLADTVDLAFTTAQKEEAAKVVKTVARVVIKDQIAHEVGRDNDALGELVRFVLIGLLEQPDIRRWETLPRWLQVARVACPPGLKSFDVVLRDSSGVELRRTTVTSPIQKRRNIHVSLYRDLPPAR